MRRSHVLLAGTALVAGATALVAGRPGPSALIAGAPLEPGAALPAAPAAVAPPDAAAPALAELLDLDRVALTAAGDHYEAVLKDGRRATLTLDPTLQAFAEKLLTDARAPRGAIVAMAPDGRVLALAGRRADPPAPRAPRDRKAGGRTAPPDGSSGGGGSAGDEPAARDAAPASRPAHDAHAAFDWRLATETWAPAASIFKLVTASALVSAGVGPTDKVCFHGGLRSVVESNLRDGKRDNRCEHLSYGVAHSNNAILGKLAFQKLEPAALTRTAHALGVADPLPGELHGQAGVVDIPATRDLGFAQIAAGFAGTQLSAIGGALLAATFADGGEQPVPTLIAAIDGVPHAAAPPRRAIAAEVARAVGEMMVATCEDGSAAKSFRRAHVRVAGKTGTLARSEPFYMEHSWFVGYAPADAPQIIVSVVLGNPEDWHLRGHEAARRLIDQALAPAAPDKRAAGSREKDRAAKVSATRRVGW